VDKTDSELIKTELWHGSGPSINVKILDSTVSMASKLECGITWQNEPCEKIKVWRKAAL
jgi:hypothetical protein